MSESTRLRISCTQHSTSSFKVVAVNMWPQLYSHLFLMQPFLSMNPRQTNKKTCLLKGALNTSTFCLVSSHKHLLPALSSESWSRRQSSSRTAATQGAGGSAPRGCAWRQGAESGPHAWTDGTRCREPTGRAACSSPTGSMDWVFPLPKRRGSSPKPRAPCLAPCHTQPCPGRHTHTQPAPLSALSTFRMTPSRREESR